MGTQAFVEAVFAGGPKEIMDERGTWTSSIFRDRCQGPVPISLRGLSGDKVTQPYHGGSGAAVCVHLADHYAFWKTHYRSTSSMYLKFEPDYVRTMLDMIGLEAWWKDQARQKLVSADHWTSTMRGEVHP